MLNKRIKAEEQRKEILENEIVDIETTINQHSVTVEVIYIL